jgi:hypothetical protein
MSISGWFSLRGWKFFPPRDMEKLNYRGAHGFQGVPGFPIVPDVWSGLNNWNQWNMKILEGGYSK